jgi:uncharacterized membrane protein
MTPGEAGEEGQMATLTAIKFDTPDGADRLEAALGALQKQQLITVLDAAVVSWPQGAKKPKTRQLYSPTGLAALGGSFWGLLFGLLFFVPLLGMAVGAATGALLGHFADVGIDDNFIKQTRAQITPGTSALFLLSTAGVTDRVSEELRKRGLHGELIASNLSQEQEARLREVFAA